MPGTVQPPPVFFPGTQNWQYAPQPDNAAPTPASNYGTVNAPFGTDLTGQEALARNVAASHKNKANEPQEICPADPDPLRMYWCRELDNSFTLRNRLTIESGDMGDFTWYINTDNSSFYAVLKKKEDE